MKPAKAGGERQAKRCPGVAASGPSYDEREELITSDTPLHQRCEHSDDIRGGVPPSSSRTATSPSVAAHAREQLQLLSVGRPSPASTARRSSSGRCTTACNVHHLNNLVGVGTRTARPPFREFHQFFPAQTLVDVSAMTTTAPSHGSGIYWEIPGFARTGKPSIATTHAQKSEPRPRPKSLSRSRSGSSSWTGRWCRAAG